MLVYRVFPYLPGVTDRDESGHPLYLHKPQGHGRWDNPVHYDSWYFAKTPECAVGETFGRLLEWTDDMFDFPLTPGSRRALGVFDVPDDLPMLDLDDAGALLARGLRPSKIVSPNRSKTQEIALAVHDERMDHGPRKWAGIQWWSQWRSFWEVVVLCVPHGEDPVHELVKVDPIDLAHPAVVAAAHALRKPLVSTP